MTHILEGYDESWVCQQYRTAKHPKTQIKILAECCNTTRREILSVLHLHGLAMDENVQYKKRSNVAHSLEKWKEAITMLKDGKTYTEAVKKTGISHTILSMKWRSIARDNDLLTEEEIAETEAKIRSRCPSSILNKQKP